MFLKDAIKLPWVKGTPFGLLVVPDVCRKRAMSSSEGADTGDLAVNKDPDFDTDNWPRLSKLTSATGIFNSSAACFATSAPGAIITNWDSVSSI